MTTNDTNTPDVGSESETETKTSNGQMHQIDQEIRRWLLETHETEITAFTERLPAETWIQLSAATLKAVCGEDLQNDLLSATQIIEDGDVSKGICGLKTVLAELTDASVEPQDITIRWTDLPDQRSVGQYRASETERLIAIEGQLEEATGVDPVVSTAAFECQRCGTITRVLQNETSDDLAEPHECQGCERQGPFNINKNQSEFINYQQLRIQTQPKHAQDGIENLTVSVTGALAGAHTGDIGRKVVVNGYLTTKDTNNWQRPFLLQARSIDLVDETDVDIETHREEIQTFEELDNPVQRIVDSKMLPGMYAPDGSELQILKFAVLLQACSPPRLDEEKRGDIHVFACGDPSTGKTAVAELAAEIAPRSEFVSTRVTGVGLTASAVNSDLNGWTIKAGAISRANGGLLVIDELDKIDKSHIEALHSPMTRQKVSTAMADQSVTYPAETSILATANPKYDRFDPYEPISEQLDISSTLLSRFDLIVTMTDNVDEDRDQQVATAVTDRFQSALDREFRAESLDSEADTVGFLRAWISKALTYEPKLPEEAKNAFKEFYMRIRQPDKDDDSAVPIAIRQLEAMHRLAIASARARHSNVVTEIDVDLAIALVERSLRDVGLDPETGELDVDLVETGRSKSQRDRVKQLKSVIEELSCETDNGVPSERVVEEMVEAGFNREKAEHEIEKQKQSGDIYEPETGRLRLV